MKCLIKAHLLLATVAIVTCFPANLQDRSGSSDLSHPKSPADPSITSLAVPTIHDLESSATSSGRSKRAIIFRPLFVYRQQELKKQQLKEQRQTNATPAPPTPQKPRPLYASNYGYGK